MIEKKNKISLDVRNQMTSEIKEEIDNFVTEIEKQNFKKRLSPKFNVFDVFKIVGMEIRHSNILAWLLDSSETHGFSDNYIKGLFKYFSKSYDIDSTSIVKAESNEIMVLREWENIDILLVSRKSEIVIAIENKIYSSEHSNQLKRYQKSIEEKYPGFVKQYLYLTLDGEEAINESWKAVTHEDILHFTEDFIKIHTAEPEVESLLNNYLEVLMRLTMQETELKKYCQEIYEKHQKAIDFILENSKQPKDYVYEELKKWKEDGKISFYSQSLYKNNTMLRLTTKEIDEIIPIRTIGKLNTWKVMHDFMIEINCNPFPSEIKLTFCIDKMEPNLNQFLIKSQEENENWKRQSQYIITKRYQMEDRNIDSISEFLEQKDSIVKEIEEQVLHQDGEIYEELKKIEKMNFPK